MRYVAILALGLMTAGCAELGPESDALARDTAKGVVNGVIAQRVPGANVSFVTDCIIDNASGPEVLQIAQAAVTGVTAQTTSLVLDIFGRPATRQCATEGALNSLVLGG